jgi:hypothetical protein
MVLLRGLLGRRTSYAPTVLNLVQCVGWATFARRLQPSDKTGPHVSATARTSPFINAL